MESNTRIEVTMFAKTAQQFLETARKFMKKAVNVVRQTPKVIVKKKEIIDCIDSTIQKLKSDKIFDGEGAR